MDTSSILTLIFTFIGSSAFTTIVIELLNSKKKKADITDTSVKTVLELEKIAMERYTNTNDKLQMVEQLLSEVREELEDYKAYVKVLRDILIKNNIVVPSMKRNISQNKQ